MGLDQYLYAKTFLYPSPYKQSTENAKFSAVAELLGVASFMDTELPSMFFEVKVAQWRKSNQIHNWFVENVQGGEDDCREYDVSREQLEELVSLCEQVIEDHSLANELLPTVQGFFFGGTDYDEWYFNDVKYTAGTLKKLLADVPSDFYFVYSSSW
jgi:hypothetical protein